MGKTRISKAYEILKDYNGSNNQILYYQNLHKNGKLILEDFGVQYILKNYNYEPFEVNKVFDISIELGEDLQKKNELEFTPKKIKIGKVIGEMGGSYHCYAQYRQSVPMKLMYLPKKYILGRLKTVDPNSVVVDFDVYDNMPSANGRKLKEHQKSGVKFLIANKKCILADGMGTGKMQDINTIIPTPNGFVRLGELSVGDSIFGSDGKEHKIIATFPHIQKDIYEIEFTDGSKTNSGLEHLWIVQDENNIRRKQGWKVLSLQQILDRGLEWKNKKFHKYKFRIPICSPVKYSEKEYLIHPYILGICIGDGNLCNKGIHISIPNHEIENVERINKLLKENYILHGDFAPSCPKYSIVKKCGGNNENIYNTEVKRLKLNVHGNNKFIPNEYKLGSIEQRKELLYGLMDSDGSISKTGNKITYSTNSKQLADDVVELVQSLGGLAKIHFYDRSKDNKSINYNVQIQINFCPFKLKRKCERYTIDMTHKKYLIKSIKSVKYLKTSDAMCIKVDSDDESYLTNNYIVTHNTTTSIIAALAGGFKNILVITTASLKTNWKKDLVLYVPEEDINIVSGSKWTPGKKFTVINYDIIDNFYEVPLEPVYETEYVYKPDGTVAEEFQVPVMVKDKNTGKMVQKMQKSRKKEDINEALMNSPLFLEDYDCVIIDEAQKLSNHDSNRYQCISDFLRKSSPAAIFLLTGTPLTNNPMNLYNILRLIDAEVTWNPKFYKTRYCGATEMTLRTGKKILKPGQPTHLNELREKIKDVYIRRLASETGEMVNKTVERRYFDLTPEERKEYDKLWNDYLKAQEDNISLDDNYKDYWFDEGIDDDKEKYRQLIEGGLIRQFLGRTMVQHTIKAVDEYLEDGEKVVVITVYNKEMEMLKNYYGNKCVVYNGKMLPKQKDKAQEKFLNDPKVKVFIGQVIACGVGLSLPVANKLIFNNFSFVNADNEQAEDRIYRLTQTNDVTCTYMLFNDSYAQEMFDKVLFKKTLSDALIKSENNKVKK